MAGGSPSGAEPAGPEGEGTGGHRRRHDRNDHEVGERGDDRKATEGQEDDRAAWPTSAAIEIARLSASQPGRAWPRTDRRRPVSGPDHAINPAVASPDSAKPGSATVAGSISRRSRAAQPRAASAELDRPVARAVRPIAAITAARLTDGEAPGEQGVADDRREA